MKALLALFFRTVRDDVRSKSTYWMRAGFVTLVMLFLRGSFSLISWMGAPGLRVFTHVLWTNVFFISIAGLSYFASSITEEKEDDTLSLLRMTNLNPLAILLGKSTGRVTGALLLLAVQFPFIILATSIGGVSLVQVLAAYATLASYLVFLANLALIFSVLCRRTSLAATLTGLALVLFLWLPGWIADWRKIPLSMVALDYDTTASALEKFLFRWWSASPLVRLKEILHTGFHGAPLAWQVGTDLMLGAACFGIAWALFDRCADRASEGSLAAGSSVRPWRRATAQRGRPWRHPLMWKDYYYVAGGRFSTIIRIALCAGLCGVVYWFGHSFQSDREWYGYTAMVMMTLVWTADLGVVAARIFRVELRGQTLSSLAVLPRSLSQIARQKALGCLLASWPAVLFFLGGLAFAAPDILQTMNKRGLPAIDDFLSFAIAPAAIAFFVHLVAWLSLRVRFGALPLAIVILVLATQVTAMISDLFLHISSNVLGFFMLGGLLFGALGLHVTIPRRLARLAAEA